jgi:ATP-binding cassette subfamily B protein RaxB
MMKIMMGLLPATKGSVLHNGRDIRAIGSAAYRRRIAGVMQNDGLFAGAIGENIACFDERPDMGWLEECAARAAILNDIRRMPMGFETLMGDMGSTLSGGQKQRVILARALYRRPDILFLDEATSHLDEPTEAAIAATLRDLAMTRVIVAHRPATIADVDQVLEFDRPPDQRTSRLTALPQR